MKSFVLALISPVVFLGGCSTMQGGPHAGHHMEGAAAQSAPVDGAMANCPMMGQQQSGQGSMMQGGMMGAQSGAQQAMQGGMMSADGAMNCPMRQQQAAPAAPTAPAPTTPADPHGH